jgi:hypothetical protein
MKPFRLAGKSARQSRALAEKGRHRHLNSTEVEWTPDAA